MFTNRRDNVIDFGNVSEGQCFEYNNHIYLKMEDVYYSDETIYNAVNLENGIVEEFENDTPVILLKNAEITFS
jgi:hypothetical protein